MIERDFYRLPELAERWRCTVSDLLHLGIQGRAQVCVCWTGAKYRGEDVWSGYARDRPEPDADKSWSARALPPGLAQLDPWTLRELDQPGAFPFLLSSVVIYRSASDFETWEGWRERDFATPFSVTPEHLCMTLAEMERIAPLLDPQAAPDKPMHARERSTLLSIIAGMAVAGWKFSPDADRQVHMGELLKDLQKLGVEVSDDTLRIKLREGLALLPGKRQAP